MDGSLIGAWNIWIDPVLGFAEIVLLLAVVYLTITQFTRSRASSYIERFNSSDAMTSRMAVDHWLREHTTPSAFDFTEPEPVPDFAFDQSAPDDLDD